MRLSEAALISLLLVLDIFVAASVEEIQTQIVQAVELAHDIRDNQANVFNCTELAKVFRVFMNSLEDVHTKPNITLERLFERQRLFRGKVISCNVFPPSAPQQMTLSFVSTLSVYSAFADLSKTINLLLISKYLQKRFSVQLQI